MSQKPVIRQRVIELHNELVKSGAWPCCLNCEEWSEVEAITDGAQIYKWCSRYRAHPPDEVVVVGCVEHQPAIPF